MSPPKETCYHEISIFERADSHVPKQPDHGKIMVDNKAFYIGERANWKYAWKNITDILFEGRHMLIIKCTDGATIECSDNSEKDFKDFQDYVLKLWLKKQGKKARKEAEEREHKPGPPKKRQYGKSNRSYAKPLTSKTYQPNYYAYSSDDEKDNTTFQKRNKSPSKEEEEPKEEVFSDNGEGENEFHDEESPHGDLVDEEDEQSPALKPKRVKGKRGRIHKKNMHDDEDSDEDMFDNAAVTTPASKRLVSPANAIESDEDEENQPPLKPPPDSAAKGNQSIKKFFSSFAAGSTTGSTAAVSKPVVPKVPPKKKPSPFAVKKKATPLSSPVKAPLKKDHEEWLTQKTPSTPKSTRRQSRFFGKTTPRVSSPLEDDDIESVGSAEPLTNDVRAHFFGEAYQGETKQGDGSVHLDINISSPSRGLRLSTSGVVRKRFMKNTTSPGKSPKRSSADEVLSGHIPSAKRVRICKPPNPYYASKSRPLEISQKPKSPWRGLRNLGNTCYLNSSLQMLFSVPTFVSSLAGKGKDLAKSLVAVSNDVKDSNAIRSSNPSVVKKALDAVTDKFEGYQQRDAHEFLSDLVDRVHDELEDERKESGTETTDSTPPFPTDEYFRMNVQVCLTCDSCGYARTKEEMYRHLSIDVEAENGQPAGTQDSPPWSVQQGIDQFFAPEKREVKCEKCTGGTTATQTLRILSRPKALLLHLKRFVLVEKPKVEVTVVDSTGDAKEDAEEPKRATAVEMAIRKNKSPVVLSPTVLLGPIAPIEADKENEKDGRMATYDVKSVAHHIGGTAWSGHYTCDAIRENESKDSMEKSEHKWVSFDDGTTSATTADQVLKSEKSQKTAYMLLYTVEE